MIIRSKHTFIYKYSICFTKLRIKNCAVLLSTEPRCFGFANSFFLETFGQRAKDTKWFNGVVIKWRTTVKQFIQSFVQFGTWIEANHSSSQAELFCFAAFFAILLFADNVLYENTEKSMNYNIQDWPFMFPNKSNSHAYLSNYYILKIFQVAKCILGKYFTRESFWDHHI